MLPTSVIGCYRILKPSCFLGRVGQGRGNKPGFYYFGDACFIPECRNKLENIISSSASPVECVKSCSFKSICMKLHILSVAVFLLSCHSNNLHHS